MYRRGHVVLSFSTFRPENRKSGLTTNVYVLVFPQKSVRLESVEHHFFFSFPSTSICAVLGTALHCVSSVADCHIRRESCTSTPYIRLENRIRLMRLSRFQHIPVQSTVGHAALSLLLTCENTLHKQARRKQDALMAGSLHPPEVDTSMYTIYIITIYIITPCIRAFIATTYCCTRKPWKGALKKGGGTGRYSTMEQRGSTKEKGGLILKGNSLPQLLLI